MLSLQFGLARFLLTRRSIDFAVRPVNRSMQSVGCVLYAYMVLVVVVANPIVYTHCTRVLETRSDPRAVTESKVGPTAREPLQRERENHSHQHCTAGMQLLFNVYATRSRECRAAPFINMRLAIAHTHLPIYGFICVRHPVNCSPFGLAR